MDCNYGLPFLSIIESALEHIKKYFLQQIFLINTTTVMHYRAVSCRMYVLRRMAVKTVILTDD